MNDFLVREKNHIKESTMLVENKEKELGLKAWQRSGGRILTLHLSSLLAVPLQLICGLLYMVVLKQPMLLLSYKKVIHFIDK